MSFNVCLPLLSCDLCQTVAALPHRVTKSHFAALLFDVGAVASAEAKVTLSHAVPTHLESTSTLTGRDSADA